MKLQLTRASLTIGDPSFNQDLYNLTIRLTISNSEIVKASDATFVVYDDTNALPANKIPMDQATLLLVLANGGEMTEHIMYIRATDTIAGTNVSSGLPRREFFGESIKNFLEWFGQESEVWTEDPGTGTLFSTNPFASNALSEYLTGTQMKIVYDLDTINYSILNEIEKDLLVVSGWNKYTWNP